MAELLNEFLGTAFTASDIAPIGGSGGEAGDPTVQMQARSLAMGKAVLNRLTQEFGGGAPHVAGPGEKAAQTFAGYGVNFGVQNGILGLIGGMCPIAHVDEIREMGEEVAQNLGLGRLMRVALRPLVQALIATPYTREMNARYTPNIPSEAALIKAYIANRLEQDQTQQWMYQLGYNDTFIDELIAQATPRLKAEEQNILSALKSGPADAQSYEDNAVGMDPALIAARQLVLGYKRTAPLRDRVLTELLTLLRGGFITTDKFDGVLQNLGLPEDEQTLWQEAAAVFVGQYHKRPNQAEMLFLYESSQITDVDVSDWCEKEGYSAEGTQLMLTYFRLKFLAVTQPASAARQAHLHAEHIAYVTDEISGLWSRPPTPAELTYWVQLLDSSQRTKHDVVTELKALPTTGPAKP